MSTTTEVPGRLRVAMLHPQRTWAETLECMLEKVSDVQVVVAHTSWDWVRGAVARGDVDVAVVGVADGVFGPQQVADLRAACPSVAVVVISDRADPDVLTATVRAGARGWLPATASAREMVEVLHGVARGETRIRPDLTSVLLDSLFSAEERREVTQRELSRLSERELEILDGLAQGRSRVEIGEMFKLSPHTVRTHINHVLRKLDVHSTLAAVAILNKSRDHRPR